MSDFDAFLARHWAWSESTFGHGRQTLGLTEHIEKEIIEIRAKPDDLKEWIDVMILAIDGYLRHGGTPTNLMRDLAAKQAENMARTWPAPGSADHAVEHVRDESEGSCYRK